jgi:hypothetical protein
MAALASPLCTGCDYLASFWCPERTVQPRQHFTFALGGGELIGRAAPNTEYQAWDFVLHCARKFSKVLARHDRLALFDPGYAKAAPEKFAHRLRESGCVPGCAGGRLLHLCFGQQVYRIARCIGTLWSGLQ